MMEKKIYTTPQLYIKELDTHLMAGWDFSNSQTYESAAKSTEPSFQDDEEGDYENY